MLLYAAFSYLLDLAFYQAEYGSTEAYRHNPINYIIAFIFYLFPWSLLAPVIYNFSVIQVIGKYTQALGLRLLFALVCGLLTGYCLHRDGISYYVGDMRPLKNLILFPLITTCGELIRTIYHQRYKAAQD